MQIIYGFLLIVAGTLMLKFNFQLVGLTGRQDWIESKLGSGSTYLAFKVLAIIIVFAGILFVSGLGPSFFNWLLSPLKNIFHFSS